MHDDKARAVFERVHRLIKKGDVIALQNEFREGLDPNLRNRFGWTFLMLAALEGDRLAGEVIFSTGADANATNDFGETAFSLAAHGGHLKFARWLLSVGASTDCRPHGWGLADWIKMSSGLPTQRLIQVLTLIGHRQHIH